MKPVQAIILNATFLFLLGVWGYIAAPEDRATELISIVFAVIFYAAVPLLYRNNRIVDFLLRVLLFLLSIAICLALIRAFQTNGIGHIIRLSLMLLTTLYALAVLSQGYIRRRQIRKKERQGKELKRSSRSQVQNKKDKDE